MKAITKKELKILCMLNEFGFLEMEFFVTFFHASSSKPKHKIKYKTKTNLNKLIKMNLLGRTLSYDGTEFFSLTSHGSTYLFFLGQETYPNNLIINSGKFHHSRLCSMVYAKIASLYSVDYRSENNLMRHSEDSIVPDLAVRKNETIVYFEVERSVKSDSKIKEKLSNYNHKFKDGYLIYLTESESITRKINKLKNGYGNGQKILAANLISFLRDPAHYLCHIDAFATEEKRQ